jgi:hypothetical protein
MSAAVSAVAAGASARERETAEVYEQREFGFWLYLMSDAIIFALLFATYAVMVDNNAGGPTGKTLFSLPRAFGETLFLLFSSATFGFATLAVRSDKRAATLAWLLVTFVLGLGFVLMEIREFSGMVQAGAGPDRSGFRELRPDLDPHHDGPGRRQGPDRTGELSVAAPGPVLAFSRHRLGRHLLGRLPPRGAVKWNPPPPATA